MIAALSVPSVPILPPLPLAPVPLRMLVVEGSVPQPAEDPLQSATELPDPSEIRPQLFFNPLPPCPPPAPMLCNSVPKA